jgi:hypothetical protein
MIVRLVRLTAALLAAAAGLIAAPAVAHHGSASVSALGTEGPGSAIDTTSAMPLGTGTLVGLVKSEYVPFQQRAGFTDQKQYSLFNTLAVGYGATPWLAFYLFQPYNVKAQDGVGTNTGLGDTAIMGSFHFKWDERLRLIPEKESLDELADWHFSVWAAVTLPVGPTTHRDDNGGYYEPDMQTGFNGPSPVVGVALMKQFAGDWTFLGEANYQTFFEQRYPEQGIAYQFGAETRGNAALAWRALAGPASRLDLIPELSVLNLQRDREDGIQLTASGGTILYGQLGLRYIVGSFAVGATVKSALGKSLNEQAEQQGSEGLEVFRAALTMSWSTRL